jgi:hypothetical protein
MDPTNGFVMIMKSTPDTEFQVLDTHHKPNKSFIKRTIMAFAVIYKLITFYKDVH